MAGEKGTTYQQVGERATMKTKDRNENEGRGIKIFRGGKRDDRKWKKTISLRRVTGEKYKIGECIKKMGCSSENLGILMSLVMYEKTSKLRGI